ncbi:MAG TPA: DUF1836 domain-containing protein [Bacillota bacterium]|nr:DUF1836 domain-containing protein [Bacillota bacterium]
MGKKDSNIEKEKQVEKDMQKKQLTLEDLRKNLEERKLIPFKLLPTIDLYMDQVITLMAQQTEVETHRPSLTPSMINNYTKQGVLPRAQGKRYTRDHLVDLTMLVYLKEVLPILDIGELLKLLEAEGDPKWRYEMMSEILDSEKEDMMEVLPKDSGDTKELALQTLRLGLISFITRQSALDLLDLAKAKAQAQAQDQDQAQDQGRAQAQDQDQARTDEPPEK